MNLFKFQTSNIRSSRYIKNTFLIVLFQGVNIISNFLLVTITLDFLGVEEYGVWITLTSLMTWFSFLDIGLAHGLRNKYAEAKTENDFEKVKGLVSTAFFTLVFLSLIGFFIFFLVGFFLNWSQILNGPANLASEFKVVGLFMIFAFFIKLILNIVAILKTADQQPSIATFLITSGNFLALASIYLLIKFYSPSFQQLGIVMTSSQIIPTVLAFGFIFSTSYRGILPKWRYFSIDHIKSIFGIGFKFFLIQVSNLVILQSNILIIAHICGQKIVADYSIAYKYLWLVIVVFTSVITPLWSASTEAYIRNDIPWLKKAMKGLNKIWLLLCLVGILLVVFSPFAYKIWLRGKIEVDFLLLIFLLLNFILTMRYSMFRMFMNGVGKIQLQYRITLIQAALHVPFAIIGAKYFGVYGVISVMILWTAINSIIEPIQFKKIISGNLSRIWTA